MLCVSIFLVIGIAIERYIAVCCPVTYHRCEHKIRRVGGGRFRSPVAQYIQRGGQFTGVLTGARSSRLLRLKKLFQNCLFVFSKFVKLFNSKPCMFGPVISLQLLNIFLDRKSINLNMKAPYSHKQGKLSVEGMARRGGGGREGHFFKNCPSPSAPPPLSILIEVYCFVDLSPYLNRLKILFCLSSYNILFLSRLVSPLRYVQ